MRLHRALTTAVLTLGLAAAAPAAHAAPAAVPGCHFSDVTFDKSSVVVGFSEPVGVEVNATAIGCGTDPYAFLNFGKADYSGGFGPSESDPAHWSGYVEFDSTLLTNSDAGTHRVTVDLDNGGTTEDLDLGIDFTLKREVWTLYQDAPSKVKKNKSFLVYAGLDVADWDLGLDVGLTKQKVQLQSRVSGGEYKTIKTVKSATGQQGGGVDAKVKIKKNTCFRWVYAGTSTKAAFTSESDCVKIKK